MMLSFLWWVASGFGRRRFKLGPDHVPLLLEYAALLWQEHYVKPVREALNQPNPLFQRLK